MNNQRAGEQTPKNPGTGKSQGSKNQLPRYAVVPNRGKGRVLEYDGGGYFVVLLPGDIRLHAHRRNLTFTNVGNTPAKKKGKGKRKTER